MNIDPTKKYRPLEKGEAIQSGDELLDDEKGWIKSPSCVGMSAPDPQFTSHRQYRRSITMNIDPAKRYQTRDGMEVRIYAIDGGEGLPVHGAYKAGGEWEHAGWTALGKYFDDRDEDYPLDLVPVKTWRAWRKNDAKPMFIIRKNKDSGNVDVMTIYCHDSLLQVLFDACWWLHEDGSESPCGVEE